MNCRHCHLELECVVLDLGFAPPSNNYLSLQDLHAPETYFPLKLFVCDSCWLVQTEDYYQAEDLFRHDYAYFSSVSDIWVRHAKKYSDMIINYLGLRKESLVVEIASNDGYLLRNFIDKNIPCLGIEPTSSTANVAERLGIPVIRKFFGKSLAEKLAREGRLADLIIGNNVYAHVPDINDFTSGLKVVLKASGTITLEFPHLLSLIQNTQFDTVYHEHFSYLSLYTVNRIFAEAGLKVWDVEELPTHGGSLRIYGCHAEDERKTTPALAKLLEEEDQAGLRNLEIYRNFQPHADRVKDDLLDFLITQKRAGKSVAAYGAAAKGNTLLNYAGIKPDLLPYVCDASSSKQGKFLPGSHIPILPPAALKKYRPDIVLILPWNIADEVMGQHENIREWGGKFAVAVPYMTII
jgi:hypothetical protein